MTGFGSVPDELHRAAAAIADTVARAADVTWRGPSGDYGHEGIARAWSAFVEDAGTRLDSLRATAEEHGDGLGEAARRYLHADDDSGRVLADLGDLLDDQAPSQAPVAGGFAGGIASVLDGGRG